MFKKFLLFLALGLSYQSLLPIKIQTGDGVEFPLTPFQKETLNSVAINNAPAGFADKDTRRFDFLDQDTFKLLLELIGPGDVFNVDRAKEILCGTSPAEFLPLLMGCSYLMVCNAALLEIIAKHYFAIQRDISWYDFVEHAQYITAFFQQDVAQKELSNASTQTLTVGSWVESVAFSPDGQTLASGSFDHTIKLWKLVNDQWQYTQTLTGHGNCVVSVAFSPDGQTLASGSGDHTIKLWQAVNGQWQCTQTLIGHGSWVYSVAFSPDGQTLASGSFDHTIKLWKIVNDQWQCTQTLTGHATWVNSVVFSPDGQTLASGSQDGTIKLWKLVNDQWQYTQTLTGHATWVNSVVFSPDGQTLASGSRDKTIKLWAIALDYMQQLVLLWNAHHAHEFRTGISPCLDSIFNSLPEQLKQKIMPPRRSACSVM